MNTKEKKPSLFSKLADVIIDDVLDKIDGEIEVLQVVTFSDCVEFAKKEKVKYPNVAGFIIRIEENKKPINGDDLLVLTQGLFDKNNKPIVDFEDTKNGEMTVSRIIHTKTIDEKMIVNLGGEKVKMFMFN